MVITFFSKIDWLLEKRTVMPVPASKSSRRPHCNILELSDAVARVDEIKLAINCFQILAFGTQHFGAIFFQNCLLGSRVVERCSD